MSSDSTIFSYNFSSLKSSFSHIFPLTKTTQDGTLYVADCGNRRVVRVGPEVEVFGEAPSRWRVATMGLTKGFTMGLAINLGFIIFFFRSPGSFYLRNMGVFWILRRFSLQPPGLAESHWRGFCRDGSRREWTSRGAPLWVDWGFPLVI